MMLVHNSSPGELPRPCLCGQIPAITERTVKELNVVRIECACGEHGGSITYIKPTDRKRSIQAACGGWDLSH